MIDSFAERRAKIVADDHIDRLARYHENNAKHLRSLIADRIEHNDGFYRPGLMRELYEQSLQMDWHEQQARFFRRQVTIANG